MIRHRFTRRTIYIGLDSIVLVGHPSVIGLSVIIIPLTAYISTILPGNQVLPSAEVAGLYEMVEIAVKFEASYEFYFDPADIRVTSVFVGPDGRRLTVRGFFDGFKKDEHGKPQAAWLMRFTPIATGRWEYQVTVKNKMGEDVSETFRIECAEKEGWRGFVRRSQTATSFPRPRPPPRRKRLPRMCPSRRPRPSNKQ